MAKDNKFSDQKRGSGKNSKNIRKETNTGQSHYGYNQRQPAYNRPADKKSPMPDYSNKPRNSSNTLPPPPQPSKNPRVPKQEQITEVLAALGSLQAVLNSYQELEMDKCQNVRQLVQAIMKKKQPIGKV